MKERRPMQTLVLPDFPDIVRKKARKYPGGMAALARKIGISEQSMYNKMNGTTEFKVSELAALDRLVNFTEDEKALVWR